MPFSSRLRGADGRGPACLPVVCGRGPGATAAYGRGYDSRAAGAGGGLPGAEAEAAADDGSEPDGCGRGG